MCIHHQRTESNDFDNDSMPSLISNSESSSNSDGSGITCIDIYVPNVSSLIPFNMIIQYDSNNNSSTNNSSSRTALEREIIEYYRRLHSRLIINDSMSNYRTRIPYIPRGHTHDEFSFERRQEGLASRYIFNYEIDEFILRLSETTGTNNRFLIRRLIERAYIQRVINLQEFELILSRFDEWNVDQDFNIDQ